MKSKGPFAPARYVRVTLVEKPDVGPKAFYLKVSKDTPALLFGTRVEKDGDDTRIGEADTTYQVISKDLIASCVEYRMNLTYGELERV